jgi:2-amino-4-hydroxy-6-hydroxymethyldihydropteridine diphosphokinase
MDRANMYDVVIGMGSNLGDRHGYLEAAAERAREIGRIVATSPVYETAPVGGPPQGDYLNLAVRIETPLEPRALLEALLGIERSLGRKRLERWAARTIDLDVLWIRDVVVDEPGLRVPHPRLTERAFALLPLVDVAPDACDPRTGASYATLAHGIRAEGVRRLAEPLRRRGAFPPSG